MDCQKKAWRAVSAYIRKPRARREPKIKRFCLKCGGAFMAEGRFNRLCPKCSKSIMKYNDSHYRNRLF